MALDCDAKWNDESLCSLGSKQTSGGRSIRQQRKWRDTFRRRPRRNTYTGVGIGWVVVVMLAVLSFASAASLEFENCLDTTILDSNPRQLQFVPLDVAVTLNMTNSLYPLDVIVYGNVSGTANRSADYPAPNDAQWDNPNSTFGKIIDLDVDNNNYSTLIASIQVASFTPYSEASRFCDSVTQGDCPLGPVFYKNETDLAALRAFSVHHDMVSSYHFSTLHTTFTIISGDRAADRLGCISVNITPDLGSTVKDALAFVPLAILILVGMATVSAAIYSPWGTTDPFRWTSNYGRDEDVLRLVTPGFGDCLQYIQFVVLTGALSLKYPGYYQPVVSQAAWSSLMFNQSFFGTANDPVVDGVYAVNGTRGLDRLEKYVGMDGARDVWPAMMVWLLSIVGIIIILIQFAFAFRWVYRELARIPEEDLRAKNMPFTVGNVIRIVYNFFFLPLISLSFFQLVAARESPAYCVALAGVVIFILICFSIWIIRLIVTTRPRSYLFDDLPTVLLYGPLYNTFSDDAAAYAVIPIFISFARGVAIGAVQASGIAQIVLLAICEVVSVLTIIAFRPFPAPSSMNFYHICFSIVRFLTILLSIVFVPSLGISEAARAWIGYVILLLHSLVLVFGFFLNALQTLIEVTARLLGAGGNEAGATRGGLVKVLGMRQLSRRNPRRDVVTRQSMASDAAMLAHTDDRLSSQFDGSRPRSLSGSSALLLNRATANESKGSAIYEAGERSHSRANSAGLYTPTTLGGFQGSGYQTTGSNSPKIGPIFAMQPQDPYYRPPRSRKRTGFSDDSGRRRSSTLFRDAEMDDDIIEGPSVSRRGTPIPAYIPAPKDDLDFDEPRKSRKDYAVREVDFYYRVRGPPLSHTGTRKLKTGPADPTGPVSSATGFFRNLFSGKTKDKGKGFEVVRSSRAPPPGLIPEREDVHEPYTDEPGDQDSLNRDKSAPEDDNTPQEGDGNDDPKHEETQLSLPLIDSGGTIELPSRVGSQRDTGTPPLPPKTPSISSKRRASQGELVHNEDEQYDDSSLRPAQPSARLPFSANSSPSRDRNYSLASTSASTSSGHDRTARSRTERPSSVGYVAQHRTRDNIHQGHPEEPSFTESAAELVNETPSEGNRSQPSRASSRYT
ncbi:uncharacterized protein DSM5745_10683 [Aspergillus mulundensis]|uniref:ML-like domain-containing protein n=1 Tax=Aspergillus mulundensis TaxID=1810919 RepID=A0A3D8QHA4_9EURO|nr:hypothetical protein DSM5745_10683 [Aspergillus mulundensis]RDW61185.1 hypothetical protein DSM5745_10683 [Aspergillus mulundensis]